MYHTNKYEYKTSHPNLHPRNYETNSTPIRNTLLNSSSSTPFMSRNCNPPNLLL